jgi:hypothetical protein
MFTNQWTQLANESKIERTISALKANGIDALVAENGEEAKRKILERLPVGADVMSMTSVTLDAIGISKEIQDSGKFNSVSKKLFSMDRKTQSSEMRKIGSAPDWAIGSVHAVTEDGNVLIASASGSQLPAYVFGAAHVIWAVGIQKIVKNIEEGIKRIYEYSLPLESERARKAYGVPGSSVNKLLIINKEMPGRITLIFVKENLGF